ncbi:MAG: Rieske (2Fe-2S) domain protein, partial [uncultured Nocardioidaceae bacterium]
DLGRLRDDFDGVLGWVHVSAAGADRWCPRRCGAARGLQRLRFGGVGRCHDRPLECRRGQRGHRWWCRRRRRWWRQRGRWWHLAGSCRRGACRQRGDLRRRTGRRSPAHQGRVRGVLLDMHPPGLPGDRGGRRRDRLPLPRQSLLDRGRRGARRAGDGAARAQERHRRRRRAPPQL